jgi:hypothetical protein
LGELALIGRTAETEIIDRDAFLAMLTPDATLTDDGHPRSLRDWIDREIFSANGHMSVEHEDEDGLYLLARYGNGTWGEMQTFWRFQVTGERSAASTPARTEPEGRHTGVRQRNPERSNADPPRRPGPDRAAAVPGRRSRRLCCLFWRHSAHLPRL